MICAQPYLKRLRRDGKADPEHRLYFAMFAAVLVRQPAMLPTHHLTIHWL